MHKLFILIFSISCFHNEKFVVMDAVPIDKLETKVYKTKEKIKEHGRIPIANLERTTEYQNRVENIDITSLDPFYIELYKMKDLLIPEDFVSFINKSHSLIKFKRLRSLTKNYIIEYNSKKNLNYIDRQKYFDAMLYYEWSSLNAAYLQQKNKKMKLEQITSLSEMPASRSWFEVLTRYWTSSSVSASEAYSMLSEKSEHLKNNLEIYQNRLGFFDDNESFLNNYGYENERYYDSTKHAELLELTEESFLANWNKVFRSAPPPDNTFKALKKNIKSLPLFIPIPNKKTVRFNPPKKGVRKYDLAIDMLYDGLFDKSGLAKRSTSGSFPNYPGRSNGWKTYMATLTEQLGIKGDVRYNWARDQWIHKTLLLGLCDIVYNYNKWPLKRVEKLYKQKSAKARKPTKKETDNLTNKPGYYLSHAMGYLKTLDLKKQLSQHMKGRFNLAEFHHRVANSYYPYDLVDIMSEVEQ